jgi:hypothetical protein
MTLASLPAGAAVRKSVAPEEAPSTLSPLDLASQTESASDDRDTAEVDDIQRLRAVVTARNELIDGLQLRLSTTWVELRRMECEVGDASPEHLLAWVHRLERLVCTESDGLDAYLDD